MPGIPAIEPYALPSPAELPANVMEWRPSPDRAVLLLHDMQEYFLRFLPASLREELVENTVRLTEDCRARGVPVHYTAQPGSMSPGERGLLMDVWGPGMKAEPEDRRVVAPLTPAPGDVVFPKWRYSAFFRSELLDLMREQGRDQILLCGVYAHVGVLATALDAFANDIQPFLLADATADFSRADHRMALEYAARRCAAVTSVKEVLGWSR